jgi:hypothetical protein
VWTPLIRNFFEVRTRNEREKTISEREFHIAVKTCVSATRGNSVRMMWEQLKGRRMFISGSWKGFWHQAGWGRQPMEQFELRFQPDGGVHGRGVDVVGVFIIEGTYDRANGVIEWVKQYVGRHRVHYAGKADGEGHIVGTWATGGTTGPFSVHPVVNDDVPMTEIMR